jgi:hypothetical protein
MESFPFRKAPAIGRAAAGRVKSRGKAALFPF